MLQYVARRPSPKRYVHVVTRTTFQAVRMQSQPEGTYRSTWHCISKIYRAEGLPVFFRGLSVAAIRSFPLHGTVLMVHEAVMYASSPCPSCFVSDTS